MNGELAEDDFELGTFVAFRLAIGAMSLENELTMVLSYSAHNIKNSNLFVLAPIALCAWRCSCACMASKALRMHGARFGIRPKTSREL